MTENVRSVAYLEKGALYTAEEMPNKENDNTARRLWSAVNALECVFLALVVQDLDCISDFDSFGSGQIVVDLVIRNFLPLRDLAGCVHCCLEYNLVIWSFLLPLNYDKFDAKEQFCPVLFGGCEDDHILTQQTV
jgi:hypothetical protein